MNESSVILDWMDDFLCDLAYMRMSPERQEQVGQMEEPEFTDEEYITFLPNELLLELVKNGCDGTGEPVGQYLIDLACEELRFRFEVLGNMAMGFDDVCVKSGVMS